jgi:hypothetical protein
MISHPDVVATLIVRVVESAQCFVVPSWEEHLRQHRERQNGADRQYEEQAAANSRWLW